MIDFSTLKRSSKPNAYLVAPEGLCQAATPDQIAPLFTKACGEIFEAVISLIKGEATWTGLETDDANHSLRFVATIPLFGFKDDIDIAVFPAGEGSTLAIYSRSRVGYSDLGVNGKRVEKILTALA